MRNTIRLFVCLLCLTILTFSGVALAKQDGSQNPQKKSSAPPPVAPGVLARVALPAQPSSLVTPLLSRPLRELAAEAAEEPVTKGKGEERLEPEIPHFPVQEGMQRDLAIQNRIGVSANQPSPAGVNVEGIDSNLSVAPPDTEGRVGPNHYVQWVNLRFQIFNKSGVPLIPPVLGNILWAGTGTACQTFNDGDPIAQYDLMADRWILTQFVVGASPDFSHQCVAVSQTGDPLGSYYLYDFVTDHTNFVDYPHWGMWPDSYYMTAHLFPPSGPGYLGQDFFIFDRPALLAGLPAGMVNINISSAFGLPNLGGALPGDLDSLLPPPAGKQEEVLAPGSPEIDGTPTTVLHHFTVQFDWSTLSGSISMFPDIPVAPFTGGVCNFSRRCVAEPPPAVSPTDYLDAISDRLMYRVAYRNFGDHESVVLNHTVRNAADTNGRTAAPRWYEVRLSGPDDPVNCPTGYPCVFQQSTYAPDLENRWMGSVAMDAQGNMALGYSRSSVTTFPSIYVTGRLASDPLSTMGPELLTVAGSGSQTDTQNRWGDYSSMTVDPHDGCTFWYTQEYEQTNGTFNWSTRIATYSFPGCTPEPQGTIHGNITQCSTGEPIHGAVVTASDGTNTFSSTTDAAGNYTITVPPGTYTVSASANGRLCNPSAPQTVTVNNGDSVPVDFCLDGSPLLKFNGDTFTDSSGDGKISPEECVTLNVSVANPGCADAVGQYGTLTTSTPGVTVDNGVASYPTIGVVGPATNVTPFSFSTDLSYGCTDINFMLTMHNSDGSVSAVLPFTIPTPCPIAPPIPFSGALTAADPVQSDRLGRNGIPSTCSGKACPGGGFPNPNIHFDTFTFTNPVAAPTCITVAVNATCAPGTGQLILGGYQGSYTPPPPTSNLCVNYLGDSGVSGLGQGTLLNSSFAFEVQPSSNFVLVVEANAAGLCNAYSGTVSGIFDTTPSTSGICSSCPAITLPPSVPGGTIGAPYSFTLTASGGTAPYNFFLTSGSLPPGLSMDTAGNITGAPTAIGSYPFTVTVTDATGCSTSQNYTIIVCGIMTISPVVIPDGIAGAPYSQTLTASGGNGVNTFSLAAGVLPPGVTLSPAGTISGTPTAGGSFNFIILVTDELGCTAEFAYTLTIVCPGEPIVVSPATQPNGQVGTTYDVFFTASGGTGTLTFGSSGSLPAGTSLNPATGELSGTLTATGTYMFTITATDANGCVGSRTYLVTVSCASINLSPTTLPSGIVGTAYSQTISATGGIGPYTFTLTGGSLPPGLTLAADGTLSGTPTAGGNFSFVVTATDSQGCFGSMFYTVSIGCASITVSPSSLPGGTVGAEYTQTISASGGTAPVTFTVSAGALPAGLTLDPNTGEITGTPTTPGAYAFTIAATDANNCTASQLYSVFINCAGITLSPLTLPDGAIGEGYSEDVTASGGTGPYTFSLASGMLPPGLSLSSEGTISGTPTTGGSYSFLILVTDANNCSAEFVYTITIVCPGNPIVVSPASAPNGQVGGSYSVTFTAAGGTGTFTFSASGTLPSGTSLNSSTGVLSGTLTATGTFMFTITATDVASGCTGSRTYLVTVSCATINLSPASLPSGTTGVPYSQTITATGGSGGFTFTLTGGTLPPGLTLATSGMLSGTPTANGNFSFVVTATDSQGCIGSHFYTISVGCPTIIVSPSSLPGGVTGAPYSQTISASGGTAPMTFTVTMGALPAGLSLNGSTGVLSGTPTASGLFVFAITATDAHGCTGTQLYVIAINCASLTISPTSLPNGIVGTAYSQTISASGGLAPLTFSVSTGSLPAGLSLDPSTGAITGTPTAVGNSAFTITVTDAAGCSATQDYTIVIAPNCLFCEEFNDVTPPTNWTYHNTWTEGSGEMTTSSSRKATAIATPAFSGCVNCSVETEFAAAAGSRVWVYAWWTDKNNDIEALFKQANGKVIVKHRIGNVIAKKQSAPVSIPANTMLDVKMTYDGTSLVLNVDGTDIMTFVPAAPLASGTIGYGAKIGVSIDWVHVN